MKRFRHRTFSISRLAAPVLWLAAWFVVLTISGSHSTAQAQTPVTQRPRHVGYGISVGPHLISSNAESVRRLGFDWVKMYDTGQLGQFPGVNVLYRVDVRGYPADISEWESGLRSLARQLDAAGVEAVEVGNEANLTGEWGGQQPNARQFTDALCRAYRVFKAEAPRIVVVAGGLAPTDTQPSGLVVSDLDFARQMLSYGAGRCFDAWGYHPYGFNQPPEADPGARPYSFRRTEIMYQILRSYGITKQIWITEFGWVRDPAEEGLDCAADPGFALFNWMKFDAQTQADYTVRAFRYADRNWPWAGPMFLWNLNWNNYDSAYENPCSNLRWYGILDGGGGPLPVYHALQNMDKRAPVEYRPSPGAIADTLVETVEAGCAGQTRLGEFEVTNTGYPGRLTVQIEPANGPGTAEVWASDVTASEGADVNVFVDATDLDPGLHMIAINLRSAGRQTVSSHVVKGWLLVREPTNPECIERYNAAQAE